MGNLCFLQFVAFTALVSAGYATLLQHSPTLITCSGDCCPECLHNAKLRPLTDKTRGLDSVSQTLSYSSDSCDERQCSFEYLEFKTRYAITDGTDFQKSGKGAIVSNVTAASIGLTVDLAQKRHGIQRIKMHGKLSMPELSISLDGVKFDEVKTIPYNETSNGLTIEPVIQSQEIPQVRYIHLQFSDVEVTEIDEMYIIAFQESCGYCILLLNTKLESITDQIMELFQLISGNRQLELLQALLLDFTKSTDKLESAIPVLRTTLEEKMLIQIELLEIDTSQISEQFHGLSIDLPLLLRASSTYKEEIDKLSTGVLSESRTVSEHLSATMMSTTEIRAISTSINGRSYAKAETVILMHKLAAKQVYAKSGILLEAITINSTVGIISDRLKKSSIKQLGLVAISVQLIANKAVNNSVDIEADLLDFQNLYGNLNLSMFTYDSLLTDSANMLMMGRILLNKTDLERISQSFLRDISLLTSLLEANIEDYMVSIRPINMCSPATVCTSGYTYAEMVLQNSSILINDSVFTLQQSKGFTGVILNCTELFNCVYLDEFGRMIQSVVATADNQLSIIGDILLSVETLLQENDVILFNKSLQLLLNIPSNNLKVVMSQEKHSALNTLFDESSVLVTNYSCYLDELSVKADLIEDIEQVQLHAENARNITKLSNNLVLSIDYPSVEKSISETFANVENASLSLDSSQIKFESTQSFLNATRRAVRRFSANVSEFAIESSRIIKEIDAIIASLGDIHARINAINSPVLLSSTEQDSSYVSLQPPPEVMINDTVQFESIDLFLWTGPEFQTPTILFYSGPICSVNNNYDSNDYFVIFLENNGIIKVNWRVGNEVGNGSLSGFQLGFSQLHITRIGASFELRYGVSVGELGNPVNFGTVSNDSILLTISNRTVFLLGGLPQGLELECTLPSIQMNTYSSFEGQIQQLLFNGEQWGLWNIRSASDITANSEFRRNQLAMVNAWHASQTSTSSAISFNGMGYLYVEQLSGTSRFSSDMRRMTITLRPNDESDGLVLYAFDTIINLSMEVYFQTGKLKLLVTRHDNNVTLINYVQNLDSIFTSGTSQITRELIIAFTKGVGFQVNGENFLNSDNAVFFSDLTNVKAWFGGIKKDAIEPNDVFVPTGTLNGYFGCVDIALVDPSSTSYIFEGDHFVNQYLSSPLQQGFSSTCLQTVYANEVGFDGTPEAYLTYRYLDTVTPPNSPTDFDQSAGTQKNLMSLSFYCERIEGILLVLQNEDADELSIVIQDSILEVSISLSSTGESTTLYSNKAVTMKEWHNILIQFRANVYEFYLDGIIQGSSNVMSEFNLEQVSGPPDNADSLPILYIGGIDDRLTSSVNDSLSPFTGCIRALTYGYEALSFLNSAQSLPRYPPGVTYHSCPFVVSTPFLPVLPVQPNPPVTSRCASPPLVTNTSHGSFHKLTQLNTSNTIGLLRRSWSLEISIQYKDDGHVLSISTAEDFMISLIIQKKSPVLLLKGNVVEQVVNGPELKGNDSVDMVILCSTNSTGVSCFLIVNNNQSGFSTLETSTFVPRPPIVLGRAVLIGRGQVESFVGCIDSLSINGDIRGFEDLHTGNQCYRTTEQGIGFTGTSLIEREMLLSENESLTVSMTFKSAHANGLLMLLSVANNSEVVFAAVLQNGMIKVSNLRGLTEELQMDLCTSNNQFTTLQVKLQNESIIVESENLSTTLPTLATNGSVVISMGSTPDDLDKKDQFPLNMLSSEESSSLPGLIGCVLEVKINDVLYNDINITDFDITKNILPGVCPK